MTTSARTVATLVQLLAARGVEVWLDGGWGVDALLQAETRPHQDVDLVVRQRDVTTVVDVLRAKGFVPVPKPDARAWNFVLGDRDGQEVDIHVVTFDDEGNGIYGPPENGDAYPATAFTGRGTVDGMPVRCLTAAFQITNRRGYTLREKDHHDIRLLKERFGP